MLSVGSLFSGIGGFDLGFERAGMRTAWFCEQDEFCQRVLARHWPGVPCYPDITELRGAAVEPVDVLCGGFPCQDISVAGRGEGIDGARSGLWGEYARLVGELRPRYVVVENVSALLARGLERVLGDLATLGYDAEWDCIPASAVGAPHRRDRLWLVAYPGREGRREVPEGTHGDEAPHEGRRAQDDHVAGGAGSQRLPTGGRPASLADADGERRERWAGELRPAGRDEPADRRADVADADEERRREGLRLAAGRGERSGAGHAIGGREHLGDADGERQLQPQGGVGDVWGRAGNPGWWTVEPDVGRVAHGVPSRMDRLRSLGNALVPQIAEWIGQRIVAYEEEREELAA